MLFQFAISVMSAILALVGGLLSHTIFGKFLLVLSLALLCVGTIVTLVRFNSYPSAKRNFGEFRTFQRNLFVNKFFPSHTRTVYVLSLRTVLILAMFTAVFKTQHIHSGFWLSYHNMTYLLYWTFFIGTVVSLIGCIVSELRSRAIFKRYRN